jgi:hypothetical protein
VISLSHGYLPWLGLEPMESWRFPSARLHVCVILENAENVKKKGGAQKARSPRYRTRSGLGYTTFSNVESEN